MWRAFLFLLPLTHTLIKTPSICSLTHSLPVQRPHKAHVLQREASLRTQKETMSVCLWIRHAHVHVKVFSFFVLCVSMLHNHWDYAKAWECVWVCMCIWMKVGHSVTSVYCHDEHAGGDQCSWVCLHMQGQKGLVDSSGSFNGKESKLQREQTPWPEPR